MKVYLAGPMFSQAERNFNKALTGHLRLLSHEVFLPQERDANMQRQESDHTEANRAIFEDDLQGVRDCDILIAILDGNVVDDGTCVEIGIAYSEGKIVYALNTDFRQWDPNLMIVGCLTDPVYRSVPDLLKRMEAWNA